MINLKFSKDLIGLGFQFFIIQAATLIVLATDNMIIVQLFGPEDVTIYNVAYKYFNYVPIIFYTLLNPFWSAYTDAYIKEDFYWIKKVIKKIFQVWILLSLLVLIMIFIADYVYDIWLDSKIKVPFILTVLMGIFAIVTNWNNIFAYFINGVGKIRLSLYYAVFVGIINIPLSVFLATNTGLGISGVIAATLICLLIGSAYAPVQYYKIINKKDTGIWGK
jgi:O-antigen/teichoic acid export membrane protein